MTAACRVCITKRIVVLSKMVTVLSDFSRAKAKGGGEGAVEKKRIPDGSGRGTDGGGCGC